MIFYIQNYFIYILSPKKDKFYFFLNNQCTEYFIPVSIKSSVISVEKSDIHVVIFLVWYQSCFSYNLEDFLIVFDFEPFDYYTSECGSVSLSFSLKRVIIFDHFLIFFSFLSFLSFWDTHFTYAEIPDIVPKIFEALFIFFSIFVLSVIWNG